MDEYPDGYEAVQTPVAGLWCLLFSIFQLMRQRWGDEAPNVARLYRAYQRIAAIAGEI